MNKKRERLSLEDTVNGLIYAVKSGSQATDAVVIVMNQITDEIKVGTWPLNLDTSIVALEKAVTMLKAAKEARDNPPAKEDMN